MDKSKLNELCQHHKFPSPLFETERVGPDHNPRFKATVSICEMTFSGADLCKSVKDAHSEAARVALDHLIPLLSNQAKGALPGARVRSNAAADGDVGVFGSLNERLVQSSEQPQPQEPAKHQSISNVSETKIRDGLDFAFSCKSQLQTYAQKKKWSLPSYSTIQEASFHPPRFKTTVMVQGKSYEGPTFANSIKESENVAAKYALSFFPELPNEEDFRIYKNILQALLQKEMKPLPIYKTAMDGPLHIPSFQSTVEVEGELFVGNSAKSKKQAEQNAAKVAYNILKERELIKHKSQSQQLVSQPSSTEPLIVTCDENKEAGDFSPNSTLHSTPEPLTPHKKFNVNHPHDASSVDTEDQTASKKSKIQCTQSLVKFSSSEEENPPQTSSSPILDLLQANANENSGQRQNKVIILPGKPDIVVPEGTTVLFYDDSWVAFRFNASNQQQTSS